MSNSKKEMKSLIISNILILALAVIMLTTMSFAWFFSLEQINVIHEMNVGKFSVSLSTSKTQDNIDQIVNVTNVYPSTAAAAQSNEKLIYGFEIENVGDIPSQIRLSVQVDEDSGYNNLVSTVKPLSGQFRYAVKIYNNIDNIPSSWADSNAFLFGSENGNISLKQFFNNSFLSEKSGVYTANSLGLLYPIEDTTKNEYKKLYVKILIWLDESATIESTGACTSNDVLYSNPIFKFRIKLEALQKGGGAGWTWDEHLKDLPQESIPTV